MQKIFRLDVPSGLDGHLELPAALAPVIHGRVVAAALAAGPKCLKEFGQAVKLATPLVELTMGPKSGWHSDTRPSVTSDGMTAFYRSASGRSVVLVEERWSEGYEFPNKGWVVTYFSDHDEDEPPPWGRFDSRFKKWEIKEYDVEKWFDHTPHDIEQARELLEKLDS